MVRGDNDAQGALGLLGKIGGYELIYASSNRR